MPSSLHIHEHTIQDHTIQEHTPLAPCTTFRIGGPARFFTRAVDQADLLEALHFVRSRSLPLFVLGGGSNLLVADAGFDGLVLQVAITGPIKLERIPDSILCQVPAGTDWDAFVLSMCEQGISGVECLAGIPGLIGGSPIQNIGAYGQEVAQTIHAVTALDRETLQPVTLQREDCGFAYRTSIFNTTHRNRYIVTAVTFRFDPAARPTLRYADLESHFGPGAHPTPIEVYHAVRTIRQGKGMLLVEGDPDCRSAGSFFKNPIVSAATLRRVAETLNVSENTVPHWPAGAREFKLSAAWLLERAGFHKGFSMGAAGISSRHTLALINRGGATFSDIAALRDRIQAEVLTRFDIPLEQEPVQLGI